MKVSQNNTYPLRCTVIFFYYILWCWEMISHTIYCDMSAVWVYPSPNTNIVTCSAMFQWPLLFSIPQKTTEIFSFSDDSFLFSFHCISPFYFFTIILIGSRRAKRINTNAQFVIFNLKSSLSIFKNHKFLKTTF